LQHKKGSPMGEYAVGVKLVSSLLVAIASYTGFGIPGSPPEIRFLPAKELQHRFCGYPCPIHAFFPQGQTIYLEQGLDVVHDPASESILVHELTHWLQQANDSHPVAQSCREWLDREYQAYDVQFRWLRDQSKTVRQFSGEMAKLGSRTLIARCPSSEQGHASVGSDTDLAMAPH
jgi:hypothetical protein